MKKIILVLLLSVSFILTANKVIKAAGQCNNWDCTTVYRNGGAYQDCVCKDGCNQCTGCSGGWDCSQQCQNSPSTCNSTGNCGPGEYVCNRPSGCCPYDTATPPPTTGGGGGGCTSGCNSCTSGCGGCTQTAPTNLSATRNSQTSATLNWTPGTAGGSGPYQALYVSTNSNPQSGCAGSTGGTAACPVKADPSTTPLSSTTSTYYINNLLTPNTIYYWQIINVQDGTCSSYTNGPIYVSSCTVTPTSVSLNQGSSQILTSSLTSGNDILRVDFSSSNSSQVSVNPASDTTYSYQTTLTGLQPTSPNVTITENVYRTGGTLACSQDTTVTVTPAEAWWQVMDADVASSGVLDSTVPTGEYFSLAGAGGYPGIPSYVISTSLDNLDVSQLGWLVQSETPIQKQYDYNYFNNQIPADTVVTTLSSNVLDQAAIDGNTTPSYGYYWYRYDGSSSGLDLTINSALSLGSKKVVVLAASANVNISDTVNFTKGSGFFLIVAGKDSLGNKGDINIDPALGGNAYDLEGIYVASGSFSTGVSALPLRMRGSVAGYDSVTLQRDLGGSNLTTPAEYFEYAPDLSLLFPSVLGTRRINWKEVAP